MTDVAELIARREARPSRIYPESRAEHALQVRLRVPTAGTDVALVSLHLRRLGADTSALDAALRETIRQMYLCAVSTLEKKP